MYITTIDKMDIKTEEATNLLRKTSQFLMPVQLLKQESESVKTYNVYPSHRIDGRIFNGYESLADWIGQQGSVIIDGYAGNFWSIIQTELNQHLENAGLNVNWLSTADYLKKPAEIDLLVEPFLGSEGSVWGTRCTLELGELFEVENLTNVAINSSYDINIMIGSGAALCSWDAPVIYIDLPKNELQFRMRGGSITNLGCDTPSDNVSMYKRFYFVDWVMLNQHKKNLVDRMTIIADGQWGNDINWAFAVDIFGGIDDISQSAFRVRPWFEPGAWGGQWIKEHIEGINKDVVNYAWSFELIVPENGIVFEHNGYLLEISFDFMMFCNGQEILGEHAALFGDEFPIRFDFLDTVNGGNLSIQCHPRLPYIRQVFGEHITQDETYYILDCTNDAGVYLGFQEDIDPGAFKTELLRSQSEGIEVDITKHVQLHHANKHDLFLIPNGTVHSAGEGNLVLEISATPYIFTFKMYDWLRLDLEGKPRPINIEHAFNNLDFNRKGRLVKQELISKPTVIATGEGWELIHLPTHKEHFYDVHRMEFDNVFEVSNQGRCHVLMLVEGESVLIETADGRKHIYAFAETFVIPAAAGSYRLTNLGVQRAKVVKAFLK